MINRTFQYTVFLFIFLFPLFFLPIVSDAYEFGKMILLFVFCLFLLLLSGLKMTIEKQIKWTPSGYGLGLCLFFLLSLISALFQAPNFITSITSPLGVSTYAALSLYYFLIVNNIDTNIREKIKDVLIFSAGLISSYCLLMTFNVLPLGTNTPSGSLLFTAIYLGIISLLNLLHFLFCLKKRIVQTKLIGLFIFLIINLAGFISVIYHLSYGQKIILLPHYFGWLIVLEVFKGLKTLFLGVGPGNFLSAFTLAKPLIINSSPVWNILFTSSSSYLFTLITEIGALTIVLFLFLLFQTARNLIRKISPIETVTLLICLVIIVFFPINTTLLFLMITLMAIVTRRGKEICLNLKQIGNLTFLLSVPIFLISLLLFYLIGQLFLGEYYFKKSLDAVSTNNGNLIYQLQIKAINSNPYNDQYHLAFSQTNLALANALASKKEYTSEDKQNIPRLVQQAIDQAKIATVLNKTNIFNWDNLAKTYASLVTFASESDKWATQAYEQRILLDPVNPNGYFSLGGFYLTLKKLDEAEKAFRQAILLKPDFANAHFNLGLVLSDKNLYEDAYKEMQTAKAYIQPASEDSKKVETELTVLQEKINNKNIPSEKKSSEKKNGVKKEETTPTSSPLNILPSLNPTINL